MTIWRVAHSFSDGSRGEKPSHLQQIWRFLGSRGFDPLNPLKRFINRSILGEPNHQPREKDGWHGVKLEFGTWKDGKLVVNKHFFLEFWDVFFGGWWLGNPSRMKFTFPVGEILLFIRDWWFTSTMFVCDRLPLLVSDNRSVKPFIFSISMILLATSSWQRNSSRCETLRMRCG